MTGAARKTQFREPRRKILDRDNRQVSSAGSSKSIRLPRNPRVLIAPKAIPTIIQIPPTIQAFQLRFFHKKKQMAKPASGGVQTARINNPMPAITDNTSV